MASENTVAATEDNFDDLVKEGLSVADFWAEWCAPCLMLAPTIDELAEKHKDDATVLKVNVDDNPGLAAKYAIHGIPTVLFFKDGKEVERLVGVRPLSEIESVLSKHE